MGAYLSKPNIEKEIEDGRYGKIVYGSCSMQGWRVSQEDSHNCLPEFDSQSHTSLFAVYDGHGGAEVAKYCSNELPNFLASLPAYQDEKDLSKALTETFLGFDASLLEDPTIEKLRQLSDNSKDEPEVEEEEEDDASLLKEEASQPLENVLEKYGGIEALPPVLKTLMMYRKKQEFKSPCLSKRRKQKNEVDSNGDVPDSSVETSSAQGSSEVDDGPSSSSQLVKSNVDDRVTDEMKETALNGDESGDLCSKESLPNGDTHDVSIKENGISDSSLENGIEDEENDEEEEEEDSGVDEDDDDEEEEEEDDEEDDDDDEDEDDDDDDDDDDDEDEEEVDETSVLSFGQQMEDSEPGVDSGTTAVVAVIRGKTLVVANAGDSRCVICREGKAVDLSVDHKPEDFAEKERITKAGGVVTQEGRVNGGLNLSRAIGDHSYKKNYELSPKEQMITAAPDIQTTELDPEKDEFIVLACDGIWNSLNSQEVVDFVKVRLDKDKEFKLSNICGELFDHCLAEDTVGDGTGCDNMTCVLVRFDWEAKDPTPTIGKNVKGIKRSEPTDDPSEDRSQVAKKIRVESD